ncbi:RNA methyltransferase [Candidatus Cyanaurora vandensis]|uniref:TrmH family RNA methyltransferase n=1 Tax=Candidatus Cyanaurora vandensis TaxID=2714958 RepID=UPI00257DF816|nr:RNA methyltransferase [Candidatus Cyanaurora vandensis]
MLTSLQNPLLKQIRKLHQAKERERVGWMLLEGPHLVEAALQTGWPLVCTVSTPTWASANSARWEQLLVHSERTEQVPEALFPELVTTVNAPGILAIARQGDTLAPDLGRLPQRWVVLERVQDPGNLGTILRTAAAVGVAGVVVSPDSIAPDHPKVLRATSGQWFRQPPRVTEVIPLLQQAQAQGFKTIGTTPADGISLWEAPLTGPLMLIFGSEGQGLSAEVQALIQYPVRIPQQPGVESLNLAVSVAVLLYEVLRQQTVH